MTRQIIDIGANANDGTGEPLRQAFQAVNDNFANVWAAGPVDSQVVISNNVISTNVTNLELILAGNGIGTVTVESTVVPKIDSVYDLGSTDQKFDSVYARYFYGNGRYLTGISGGGGGTGGNVYFSSSPPLSPNIGDIWIDSDTAVQYLYFNDNTSNQWAEMEAYQSFSSGVSSGNGVPGGSNTQIQFNSDGNFGGSSSLTWDGANLTTTGLVTDAIYTDGYYYANGDPFAGGGGSTGNVTFNDINIIGNGNLHLQPDPLDSGAFLNIYLTTGPDIHIAGQNENVIIGADTGANVTVGVDGTVRIQADSGNAYTWTFGSDSNLSLPAAPVESTPDNPGFSNQTQKSISGAIETVAGNPLPSYTNSLGQTETIWTATNSDVTSARMTLRIQYNVGPVAGVEMCDVVLAKEWGTDANVSYVISNRLRTNNSLSYANVVAALDGSNNLIVNVTNGSNLNEYYSYSITEFNWTND